MAKQAAPQPAKARSVKRRIQTASAGPSKDRREIILEIAKRRFAEFGYRATTIREIATDAHILSGSIYHHFDTKDEILDNIISGTMNYLNRAAQLISGADCDAEHRLISWIRFSLTELTSDQETHTIIWNERRLLRQNPNFERVVSTRQETYYIMRGVIIDGIKAGLFRQDLDPFLAISSIIRLLYTSAEWFASDSAYSLEEVTNFHLQFILNGIRSLDRMSQPIPQAICVVPEHLADIRAALVRAG